MLLQGKRIVYIEDDMRNRLLVNMMVHAEGGQLWFERWGVPALAVTTVISHLPLDLILLDLMFPNGFTGYDIFTELRQFPALDGVPVVLISAADASVEMPKAREKGFAGYLSKPVDADLFAAQLKDIIEGKAIWEDHLVRR